MSLWNRILQKLIGANQPKIEQPLAGKLAVSPRLENNLAYITELFADVADFVCRRLSVGGRPAALLYLRGITDARVIQEGIAGPLLQCQHNASLSELLQCISVSNFACLQDLHQALLQMLEGKVLLLCQGLSQAILVDAANFPKRNIAQPESDVVISGPQEGFIEHLADNFALVRRRLRTPKLKSRVFRLGALTRTTVMLCYLQDRVGQQLLAEVETRLQQVQDQVDLPDILDSYAIMELISDHPRSPFPQLLQTERPDVIVANLVEGRVAILVDGSPVALVAPAAFFDFFQTADDYNLHPIFAASTRWLRFLAVVISTSVSALYVAVVTYHYEIIPARIITTIARTRSMVPLSSFTEAILMEITVDLLREASVRLPGAVGQVIGVLGALVVGQAAVQANIVAPLMVIVVAISTISSFLIPNNEQATALRLLRFPLIVAANFL